MKTLLAGIALCLLLAGTAQGQVHRWVDKDGNVHFGDTIPPEDADQMDGQSGGAGADSASKQEPVVTESVAGEEIERRKEAARRAEADRVLLRTYLSVEEIEELMSA